MHSSPAVRVKQRRCPLSPAQQHLPAIVQVKKAIQRRGGQGQLSSDPGHGGGMARPPQTGGRLLKPAQQEAEKEPGFLVKAAGMMEEPQLLAVFHHLVLLHIVIEFCQILDDIGPRTAHQKGQLRLPVAPLEHRRQPHLFRFHGAFRHHPHRLAGHIAVDHPPGRLVGTGHLLPVQQLPRRLHPRHHVGVIFVDHGGHHMLAGPLLLLRAFAVAGIIIRPPFHLCSDKLRIKLAAFPLEAALLARVVAFHPSQVGAAARRFLADFFQGKQGHGTPFLSFRIL